MMRQTVVRQMPDDIYPVGTQMVVGDTIRVKINTDGDWVYTDEVIDKRYGPWIDAFPNLEKFGTVTKKKRWKRRDYLHGYEKWQRATSAERVAIMLKESIGNGTG